MLAAGSDHNAVSDRLCAARGGNQESAKRNRGTASAPAERAEAGTFERLDHHGLLAASAVVTGAPGSEWPDPSRTARVGDRRTDDRGRRRRGNQAVPQVGFFKSNPAATFLGTGTFFSRTYCGMPFL